MNVIFILLILEDNDWGMNGLYRHGHFICPGYKKKQDVKQADSVQGSKEVFLGWVGGGGGCWYGGGGLGWVRVGLYL